MAARLPQAGPDVSDPKEILESYLQRGREALLWKLEGLSEYDAHRPTTGTGTNLLGIVKHVASVEAGYLGDCFGRPFEQKFPWFAPDAEPNADFVATGSLRILPPPSPHWTSKRLARWRGGHLTDGQSRCSRSWST